MTRTAAALTVAAVLLAGCGSASGEASPDAGDYRIALLLPESKTARYEAHDRPAFEERLAQLCPACEAITRNADQDAARQQAQAEAAITNGADVLVLDPVDSASAAVIVEHATARGIPVITYDRMVLDVEVVFHVTFDNERVGALQADALVEAIGDPPEDGVVVMLNGSPTDDNASQFRRGARTVLDASDLRVGVEVGVHDWSPDKAQEAMEQAIATLGRDRIIGVYSANDGMAGGAIAAMKAAGLQPLPPVTGQDAELAAVRRILAGEQHMTVYKAVRTQARLAAEIALAVARTGEVPDGVRTGWLDNGATRVPTLQLEPLAVTRDQLAETVVADGFWTVEEICDGLEAACDQAGVR